MFLRRYKRKKNGKQHEYFSVVENRRVSGDKTVQRTVLYLGEITSSQESSWRKTLDVFDEDTGKTAAEAALCRLCRHPQIVCRFDTGEALTNEVVPAPLIRSASGGLAGLQALASTWS